MEHVPCSKDPLDRFLGASLLCTTGYMHWAQSHLAHHVKVMAVRSPKLNPQLWPNMCQRPLELCVMSADSSCSERT